MKNGEESFWNALGAGEIKGHTAETEIHDACTVRGLVAKGGVRIGAGHGNALRFARHGEDARFGDDGKGGL